MADSTPAEGDNTETPDDCCPCMCRHQHAPDPTLIDGPHCVACKWCSCRAEHEPPAVPAAGVPDPTPDGRVTLDELFVDRVDIPADAVVVSNAELSRLRAMEQRAGKVRDGDVSSGAAWQLNVDIARYILGEES